MSAKGLAALIDGSPLVVCLGPGGVGKTTISSVLALHRAAAGARALVLTIDPARRLADALGLAGLTNDPAPVTAFSRLHPKGSLAALMLDPANTFDHLISVLVVDPAQRERLLQNRFYQHMSRSLVGTLEYMAVERLHDLVRAGTYDGIVLDTPPTTNALDFLEAPERLASFFSDRMLRVFQPSRVSGSWTARLFSRAGSVALGLMSRVAGQEFVDETTGFFETFTELFGSFRTRGVEVGRLLRDPKSVFVIVLAPDPGRLAEAKEIDRRLAEAGCPARAFIVNRVDEAFLPDAGELEEAVGRAAALLGGPGEAERVRLFLGRLEALRASQASTAAAHTRVLDELRAYAGDRPVYTAPSVPAGQSPRASLLAIYVGLFASDASAVAHEEHARGEPDLLEHRRAVDRRHEGKDTAE